jgi:hypothetical protein
LFRNGAGRYDDKQVHENFITSSDVGTVKERIIHYTYGNLADYFDKFNFYTSKSAAQDYERGKNKSLAAIYFGAKFNFFKSYVLNLGFLDGYEGYLLSKAGAMYVLVKYFKLRELNK